MKIINLHFKKKINGKDNICIVNIDSKNCLFYYKIDLVI